MQILNEMDFELLLNDFRTLLRPYFPEHVNVLMGLISSLCDANFKCYQANMRVISIRNSGELDHKTISNCELIARTVGERRVHAKFLINKTIGDSFRVKKVSSMPFDDIIYSVGEMFDRLSIEHIKQASFDKKDHEKINASRVLSDRVLQCLKSKLQDIREKGFYEYLKETRTYQLKEIEEEGVE